MIPKFIVHTQIFITYLLFVTLTRPVLWVSTKLLANSTQCNHLVKLVINGRVFIDCGYTEYCYRIASDLIKMLHAVAYCCISAIVCNQSEILFNNTFMHITTIAWQGFTKESKLINVVLTAGKGFIFLETPDFYSNMVESYLGCQCSFSSGEEDISVEIEM